MRCVPGFTKKVIKAYAQTNIAPASRVFEQRSPLSAAAIPLTDELAEVSLIVLLADIALILYAHSSLYARSPNWETAQWSSWTALPTILSKSW